MTDEDDRMNRAKRIREMREGNRDGGDAGDEPSDAGGEEADDKQTMEDLVTEAAESESGDDPAESGEESDDDRDEIAKAVGGTGEADEETAEPAETGTTTEEPPVDDGSDTETGAQDGEQQSEADTGESEETGDVTAPLPDADTLEAALDEADEATEAAEGDGDDEPTPAAGSAEVADAKETTTEEEETRVLEFTLDDENYCLDIEYIEEIVKEETITRVPNTPEYVAGVVDLRGQITTILNPKVTLGKENTAADELIVVFDSEAFEDQGHLGWVVDDVRQVSPIVESEVNDPPMEAEYINGVIDRGDDEGFVIWTSPDLALEEAD